MSGNLGSTIFGDWPDIFSWMGIVLIAGLSTLLSTFVYSINLCRICNDLLQIQSLLLNNCCNNVALTGKLLLTFQSRFLQNFPLVKT